MTRFALRSLCAAVVSCLAVQAAPAADGDRDGLDDSLEQALLVKFTPRFLISAGECDGLPSEFQAGSREPKPAGQNGVVYGQVFPVRPLGLAGSFVEVRYYHLWSRDCGRAGHFLDVEHVAVLVQAGSDGSIPEGWKAQYWFAAAHQDTVCDASNGAKAQSIDAENQGPVVWLSSGKHASYLGRKLCSLGCGGDSCDDGVSWTPNRVINLGEPGAPLNGAEWVDSPGWTLEAKMKRSEFTPVVLDQLASASKPDAVRLYPGVDPVKAVILAGDTSIDALAVGKGETGSALNVAGKHTDSALDKGAASTGRSLKKARGAVGRWFKRQAGQK